MNKLPTMVSQPFWPVVGQKGERIIQPAALRPLGNARSWLDWLLQSDSGDAGGVLLPPWDPKNPRALMILLTGAPGSGKSTLASELCYRWSRVEFPDTKKRPRITYYTSEAHPPWKLSNVESYRWRTVGEKEPGENVFITEDEPAMSGPPAGKVAIRKLPILSDGQEQKLSDKDTTGKGIARFLKEVAEVMDVVLGGIGEDQQPAAKIEAPKPAVAPWEDIVVFDSLNTEPAPEKRVKAYQHFSGLVTNGVRIILVVADASSDLEDKSFWEYHSDLVIRMGRSYGRKETEYMVRDIEVVKARYQQHKWGRHQLKIYPGRAQEKDAPPPSHPFRYEGGIFIFPSIHSVLSFYKQHPSSPAERAAKTKADAGNALTFVESGIPGFEDALALDKHAYPRARCTALVGRRGGHKSHLAFHEMLYRITRLTEKAAADQPNIVHKGMIVSLRDDESTTRTTLCGILASMDRSERDQAEKSLAKLELEGKLEINYFPPGYITPEEFFHRTLLSINKLGGPNTHVTVVFNSLDQLDSRFPLCAEQRIFIPGVIQMLCSEGVSSFFVGAASHDAPTPGTFHGLRSMAELILEFSHESLTKEDLERSLSDKSKETRERIINHTDIGDFPREFVKVKVARYAGGKAAGASGLLELVEKEKSPFFAYEKKTGLVCISHRKATPTPKSTLEPK